MILTTLIALPLITAILTGFVWSRTRMSIIETLTVLATGAEVIASCVLAGTVLARGTVPEFGILSMDALGAYLAMIISVVGFFAALYSIGYFRSEMKKGIVGFRRVKQYYVLIAIFRFAMYAAVAASSPIVMWIAIEATTLSTAFLISFYNKQSATEAAWKYLIINSLGLLLGLLGTLLFLTLPTDGSESWIDLLRAAPTFDPLSVKVAFALIFVGFATKAGLVPLHTWKPDAYSKAPTPLVALLSGVLLNVAMLAILRFKMLSDAAVGPAFASTLLIFFGALSVVLAALIIFAQKNYKRLLAYSSIEHAGIIAVGFGFGGIGVFAALLHMLYHALGKSLLFLSAGNIFVRYGSTKMKQVTGMLVALPVTSLLFFAGFLAATGVPPFGTFATELTIISAGFVQHPFVAGIVLIGVLITFIGFFRHVYALLWGEVPQGVVVGEIGGFSLIMPFTLAIVIITVSFYVPSGLGQLIRAATNQITHVL